MTTGALLKRGEDGRVREFSFDTIKDFDRHIHLSIPNYDVMFDSLLKVSEYFIDPGRTIYDIGCSTGRLLKTLAEKFPTQRMIGFDSSANLLPQDHDHGKIRFALTDLNQPQAFPSACLVFSIFTLQFLKKEFRPAIVQAIFDGLPVGGAFIIAEKSYASEPQMQDVFTSAYYDYKAKTFSAEEIFTKERDLRLILRPQTSSQNRNMLYRAGFSIVEPFYKYFQFEACICIK